MKKTAKKLFLSVFVVLMVFTCALLCGKLGVDVKLEDVNITTTASAAIEGYYTYSVSDGNAEITDVNTSISSNVVIPSTLGGYKVTSIGDYAFAKCKNLTNVTIPKGVISIGDYSFWACTSLTSIIIPNGVVSMGESSFRDCTSLTKVTIPDSVTLIDVCAFSSCTSLTKVTIPDGVTLIDACAFSYCTNLKTITIPNTVTSIEGSAFSYCTSLKSITIPKSVTTIGAYVFMGCSELTSISIPDSVTAIGAYAFRYCSGLKNITIGKNVTSIGEYAFENCTSCTNIAIPDSVTSIGKSAFKGCTSLTKISLPFVGASQNGTGDTHFGYIFGAGGYFDNTKCVPNNLQEVTISSSCKKIDDYAFSDCTSIKKIAIGKTVTQIGNNAFDGCTSLTTISLPDNVRSIGENAFYDTGYYNNIFNWEDKVLYIDNYLIKALTSITSCEIQKGTKTIADYAFYNCRELTSIIIPDSVTSMGYAAFYFCSGLTEVTIGKGIKSIESYTFGACVRLVGIAISAYLTNIEKEAFLYTNVEYVFYGGSEEQKKNIAVAVEGNDTFVFDAIWHYNATNHYGSYKTTKKATCTTDGEKQVNCTVCGYSGTVTIKKLGHSYSSSYTVDKKATCTTTGSKSKHCTRSGCTAKTSVTSIAKIAHVYKTTTTKATLTKSGCIKTVCTGCGTVKSSKAISYPKTFTLSATSLTYNGSVRTPTVTVKDATGKVLKKDTDYTVSYSAGRKNVGTYKVTVKMKGNYTGTKTLTFKITPMSISKCTVSLSATSYTYDGKVKAPTVTVKNANGAKLTKDTHYTVTYASGRKNVGTYKVTIKMLGNYTGTKTLTFKITPPKTTVASLTAGTKKITVNLTKKTTQTTGYQIQYSTSKDFTNAKTVTIANNSTVKTTLTGLTAAKTYYVRVRTYKTVNDVKYYSDWSASKYVKTK